jgi:hypothetical protein
MGQPPRLERQLDRRDQPRGSARCVPERLIHDIEIGVATNLAALPAASLHTMQFSTEPANAVVG